MYAADVSTQMMCFLTFILCSYPVAL